MNHHLAASRNLGQTIRRNYPLAPVEKLQNQPEEIVDVVGPLRTPLDTLGPAVALPRAEVGDLIGIFQSGPMREVQVLWVSEPLRQRKCGWIAEKIFSF